FRRSRERELRARINEILRQRLLKKIADHRQRAVRAFAPVAAAHRDPRVVEADPRAGDQARVHQDNQPSVFFCVVPVFPARSPRSPYTARTAWPVPLSTAPRSMLIRSPTTSLESTGWLSLAKRASTRPFLSVTRVT